MENKTTIQVNSSTLERLKSFKRHEKESYDFTLNILMDEAEDDFLSTEEIEDIKVALEEVKRGETIPFEQVLKEKGIVLD